ncbi:uncharacterized protein LOC8057035 isoform X1 [Sorghum bicolor]|uniref:uncharacterized protein LOC8057035 isoform X1 n=1 Tax=Sorghum bicolor TaxID=4558 RepID=UPI000B425BCB|nr:uncharacterized protein LOC8057035 isoform X1 [Sorghum bicolor]|eukprot:XP_021312058.1 uncharacterized protein LOC8057035 isoform X1 [Sorghum bicolor]
MRTQALFFLTFALLAVLAQSSNRHHHHHHHSQVQSRVWLTRSESISGFRAGRRRRRGACEPGQGGGASVAVLRQLRRVHQVGAAAVPVPGRGAPRVPPGVQGLRQVQSQRRPAGVPVHGPRPQLLPAPLHRARRRALTARPAVLTTDFCFAL